MTMSRSNTPSGRRTSRPPLDRDTAVTRSMLGCGVLAGVLYRGVGIVQGCSGTGTSLPANPLAESVIGPNASATKDVGAASTILNWSP